MTDADDPRTLLSRALDQVADALSAVGDKQWDLPTPCRSWTVAQLGDHLVADLGRFTVTANGGQADWSTAAPEVTGDRALAFTEGAEELLNAWRRAGDLTGTITRPGIGEVPARFPVDQQVAEFAMHAWDIVRATGQPADLDPLVGQSSLDWVRNTLRPQFRGDEASGKAFGPEMPVADNAPLYDQLAAFAGRDPGWTSP